MKEEDYRKTLYAVFSERTVNNVYGSNLEVKNDELAFGVEYLPGQYDQRADSASECYQLLTSGERIEVKWTKIMVLKGALPNIKVERIKNYYINPADPREVNIDNLGLSSKLSEPRNVKVLSGFTDKSDKEIEALHSNMGLAMSLDGIKLIRGYFKEENKNPSITEIKIVDAYWSDHCGHTTFSTVIESVVIEEGLYTKPIIESYEAYLKSRSFVYGETDRGKTLMDIAVITMKGMRKKGLLEDLDVSDEINTCPINVNIETNNRMGEYSVMFKNETHNHPTEIEPSREAATCLGEAIRDPLSERTYVYQTMRVTGAADPTVSIEETLKGKLPQRTITLGAAHGYSSCGNQIGPATGQVSETYHPNYAAKGMEVETVIAAVPRENIVRKESEVGDVIILLGGRTGGDGLGGATGSSKEHTEGSISECGTKVRKGNPPTERKIQRLFKSSEVSKVIKRCNDFGADGVSVAIGELTRGLDIDLDKVPEKYEGLDGTEIAVSESRGRMTVVVNKEDEKEFINLCAKGNLETVKVAEVTDNERLRMVWKGKNIVDLKRELLDINEARQTTEVEVKSPKKYPFNIKDADIGEAWINILGELNVSMQKGLVERFGAAIGVGTVFMSFSGKYQTTPAEDMVAKIPVLNGGSKNAALMTYGFNPGMGVWSPYHMAYYSVIEVVAKLSVMGGDYKKAKLTLQGYFERLRKDRNKWGKPFSALLGTYQAQMDLGIPAIGGKDSMSGTFGGLNVLPSLVAFAVDVAKAKDIISPEFKNNNSGIVLLMAEKNEDMTLKVDGYKENLEKLHELILDKKVTSASSLRLGGVVETLARMSLGDRIGVEFKGLSKKALFELNYRSLVLEVSNNVGIEKEFNGCAYKVIGNTTENRAIVSKEYDVNFDIEVLEKILEEGLSSTFKVKTEDKKEKIETALYESKEVKTPLIKVVKPEVFVPVFPGTDRGCDCARAFKNGGAEVSGLVLNNMNRELLNGSVLKMEENIRGGQIIMLPGGFSAGDEPDGSGKSITAVLRNEGIKDAVMDLLENGDGSMLGICNGFQALIKLGLVPYGEIVDIEEGIAILTYNEINRHISSIVRTKIASNKSPWFNQVNLEDIHSIAASREEGRFAALRDLIEKLKENGQIITQYVDLDGEISTDMPSSPNGSMLGIEGITSPDGRILGEMGHSERIGENLYKNIPENFDQKISKTGIRYFK